MYNQFGGRISYTDLRADRGASANFDSWLMKNQIDVNQLNILPQADVDELIASWENETGYMRRITPGDTIMGQSGLATGAIPTVGAPKLTPVSQALLSCTSTAECNKYGKDDIFAELKRRGLKPVARPKEADEFNQNALKPDLVDILLNHNKREVARLNLIEKRTRMGTRSMQGSLPSEATNPAMYDANTGLLQEKYLTQDHHGLTAFDYKGEKWVVQYQPLFNGKDPNPWGGDAKWVKAAAGSMQPGGRMKDITGQFAIIDKRGLPKVSQLNYVKHAGNNHKGKNGKWYILVCPNRKNKKSLSIHPSNCRANKNGTFAMKWVLFDKEYTLDMVPEQAEDRKFFLPDGSVVTGKQLNKLSLEEIWRMMMLLELMEQGPAYALKMRKLGIGPGALGAAGSVVGPGGVSKVPGVELTKRKRSLLDSTARARDEDKFAQAGLSTCEYPRPPFRCYSDSYIPGACVPHEEICFNGDYASNWDSANNYGRNPAMNWAQEKRAELNRAGALVSEEAYEAWKAQQEITQGPFGARGAKGSVDTGSVDRTGSALTRLFK